jgi:carbon starvation protein
METTQANLRFLKILWSLVAIIGAISFGILAVSRGEHVNAVWLVLAAVCVYSIAYRFYSLFIATKFLN